MNLKFTKQAVKAVGAVDNLTKQRLRRAIQGLPQGDVKRLRGSMELYRLRVGDWRIVFSYVDKDTILVEKIAPRGEVYKGV